MENESYTDDELIARLRAKYDRPAPGACPHCGTTVTVQEHAGGYPLPWACPKAVTELKAALSQGAPAEVLQAAQDHVEASRWEDFRKSGDRRVMELIQRYEALRKLAHTPCW